MDRPAAPPVQAPRSDRRDPDAAETAPISSATGAGHRTGYWGRSLVASGAVSVLGALADARDA